MRHNTPSIESYIRTISDFPKEGVQFKDVTSLFADPEGFRLLLDQLQKKLTGYRIDIVAGIDARGFVVGGALADRLRCGFVTLRKKGKLPPKILSEKYTLEYGEETLELQEGVILPNQRVLLVDDILATGGTAQAAIRLVERVGAYIVICAFIAELPDLGGSSVLKTEGYDVFSLCEF